MFDSDGRLGNWNFQPQKRAPRLFQPLGRRLSQPDASVPEAPQGLIDDEVSDNANSIAHMPPTGTAEANAYVAEFSHGGNNFSYSGMTGGPNGEVPQVTGPTGMIGMTGTTRPPEGWHNCTPVFVHGRLCLHAFYDKTTDEGRYGTHILIQGPAGLLRVTHVSECTISKCNSEDLVHVGLVYMHKNVTILARNNPACGISVERAEQLYKEEDTRAFEMLLEDRAWEKACRL